MCVLFLENLYCQQYVSNFRYPHSFLCLTFHFSFRATRFFNNESNLSELWEKVYPTEFSLRNCKVFHSIQAKRNAVCDWKWIYIPWKKKIKNKNINLTFHFLTVNQCRVKLFTKYYLIASYNVNFCCKYSTLYNATHQYLQ